MNSTGAEAMARAGRLYPSLIVHGGEPEGRRETALRLARLVLCERSPEERPCGDCRHCRRIVWPEGADAPFHPDFRVLERDLKTSTSVDATKQFLTTAQLSPFEARGQVFVVASAESLTGEAANALLKTLEEPPTSAPRHFLLLAPSQFDLLPTLRSRSLAIFLGPASRPDPEAAGTRARAFAEALAEAPDRGGGGAGLFAAAEALAAGGDWSDPRARAPWEEAATAVVEASRSPDLEPPTRRRLLALAEELLEAPRLRVRGITARRILEGLVHRHLG